MNTITLDERIYNYILTNPISAEHMMKYVSDKLENINVFSCEEQYPIFRLWFPFIVKTNHYSMAETIDILNIIAENDTCRNSCAIQSILRDTPLLATLVKHMIQKVKFTNNELSEILNLTCDKIKDYDPAKIKDGLIIGMRYQSLDEKFLYDNYINLFKDSEYLENVVSYILPILPDQEGFITRYTKNVGKLKAYIIFNKTVLSDDFIIDYIENNKEYFNDALTSEMAIFAISMYRKFSPRLIKYFTDNGYKNILEYYGLYFGGKSVEFKKERIERCNAFDCYKDYFYAYKSVDTDNYSYYTFRFKYEPGKTYETVACRCRDNTPGFYVSDIDRAKAVGEIDASETPYRPYKIIKVKVYYDDIAWVSGTTVRCSKFTVCD